MTALSEHITARLDEIEAIARRVASGLRAKHLRAKAARPLTRAVRDLLQRSFVSVETIRSGEAFGPAATDDSAPDASDSRSSDGGSSDALVARKLYLIERNLDRAESLLLEAVPDVGEADAGAGTAVRSPRYFDTVRVWVVEPTSVRCMLPGYQIGGNAWVSLDAAERVEARAERFLDVLSTDNTETPKHIETHEYAPRLLPDYWDLELLKRQKKKKKQNPQGGGGGGLGGPLH